MGVPTYQEVATVDGVVEAGLVAAVDHQVVEASVDLGAVVLAVVVPVAVGK